MRQPHRRPSILGALLAGPEVALKVERAPKQPTSEARLDLDLLAVSDGGLVAATRTMTVGAVEGPPAAEPTEDPGRADDDGKQIGENKAMVASHVEDVGPFERLVHPEPHDAQQQERCDPPAITFPAPAQGEEHGRGQGQGDHELEHASRVGRPPPEAELERRKRWLPLLSRC
jgi:hypothetical protein